MSQYKWLRVRNGLPEGSHDGKHWSPCAYNNDVDGTISIDPTAHITGQKCQATVINDLAPAPGQGNWQGQWGGAGTQAALKNLMETKSEPRFYIPQFLEHPMHNRTQDEHTNNYAMWKAERQRIVDIMNTHTHPRIGAGMSPKIIARYLKEWNKDHTALLVRYMECERNLDHIDKLRMVAYYAQQLAHAQNDVKNNMAQVRAYQKSLRNAQARLAKK